MNFDHNVLVLGLGVSGLALARWQALRRTSRRTRESPPQLAALKVSADAVFVCFDMSACSMQPV
jgi:UDP-N-acetylmuramoylalanine-D-glutamate ligase